MIEIKRISAKMIPALESISRQPMIGDIGSVPAVRVELKYSDQTLSSIGIVDTGAGLCVLDERIFKMFSNLQPENIQKVMATGFSKHKVLILHLSIRIIGDEPYQALDFENVPVAVTKLDRQMLIIGRRGVLERLRIELDFPRNQMNLIMAHPATNKYPALAHEFPSLDSVIQSLEENRFEPAIMTLAWDMERFLDSITVEDPELRASIKKRQRPRSLGEKLQSICQTKQIINLTTEIQEFVNARNTVAHLPSSKIDRVSTERVLEAAEAIVSRLIIT
jgi:hypothetical protein